MIPIRIFHFFYVTAVIIDYIVVNKNDFIGKNKRNGLLLFKSDFLNLSWIMIT